MTGRLKYADVNGAEKVCAGLAIGIFLAVIIIRLLAIGSPGSDLAGVESNVVFSIIRVLGGHPLYSDPAGLPFSITQYTPLYYYICSFVVRIFVPDPVHNYSGIYFVGRSLNLVFNLLTAWGIFRLAGKKIGVSRPCALFVALAAFVFVFPHNLVVRPDSLHDTFAIWSIYHFIGFNKNDSRAKRAWQLLPAILLSTGAILSKQNGIQLPALFTLYFLLDRRSKWAAVTLLLSLASLAAVTGVIETDRRWFLANVIGGIENGIDLPNFWVFIVSRKLFLLQILPFFLASLYVCSKKTIFPGGSAAERFLALATLGTFLFATLTAFKKGSNLQYYTVFSSISLVLVFSYLERHRQSLYRVRLAAYVLTSLMMLSFLAFFYQAIIVQPNTPRYRSLEAGAVSVAEYLRDDLRLQPGEFVFANLSTDYSLHPRGNINNLLPDNCVVPQLDILNYSTGPLPVFGYKNFDTCLVSGKIRYIIESDPPNPFVIDDRFRDLVKKHYRLVSSIAGYRIYRFSE